MAQIRPLNEELQKKAVAELGEDPARIEADLEALKTWIKQQPHLQANTDDQFLVAFLRGCKYSMEKAKVKIDLFFTLKSKFPVLFNLTDINEAKFRNIFNFGFGIPLPRPLNDNGARIISIRFEGDIAKGLINIEELYSVLNALHEIILMDDPYACINGVMYIFDLKNISMNLISQITPNFLRKIVKFYEKSLPLRIKGAHMINTPGIFQSVLNIMLSLCSEKLRGRIFVYGQNYDDMEKLIPKKYLPVYLGGENGSTDQLIKDFDKKWLEYENYFKENANYGTNELLRPGKPIDFDSMYGLSGSFRKLEVD